MLLVSLRFSGQKNTLKGLVSHSFHAGGWYILVLSISLQIKTDPGFVDKRFGSLHLIVMVSWVISVEDRCALDLLIVEPLSFTTFIRLA